MDFPDRNLRSLRHFYIPRDLLSGLMKTESPRTQLKCANLHLKELIFVLYLDTR